MNKRLENRIEKYEKEGNSLRKSIIKELTKIKEFTFLPDTYDIILYCEDALLCSIKEGVLSYKEDNKSFDIPIDELYLWELLSLYNILKVQEGI